MSHDDFEIRLGDALHRASDAVSTIPPSAGPELVDGRVRQRARRRRRNLGLGAVAAVAVLGGGVIALRPDPAVRVKFAAPLGSSATTIPSVATGYATGSMSGSPTGWSHPQVDATSVALPKVALQLDSSWTPSGVYADSITQGSGTPAAPMAVVISTDTSQSQFVVVSVQTPKILGPGVGGVTFSSGGLKGRVLADNGKQVRLIADVPDGHRVQVGAVGLDRATVLQMVSTLHQDNGAWVMTPSTGLTSVATTPPTDGTSRNLSWTQGPIDTSLAKGNPQDASLTVSSGGAYEYYAQLAMLDPGATVIPAGATFTTPFLAGAVGDVVTAASFTSGSESTTLVLDSKGIVYTISRWGDPTATPTTTASGGSTQPTLVVLDASDWSTLVNQAAAGQAQQQSQAIARKNAAIQAQGLTAPTIDLTPTTAPPTAQTTTQTTTPGTP